MRRLVWPMIGLGLLVWSALAYFAHGLVGWAGNLAAANADVVTGVPEAVEWLSWLAVYGSNVAGWLVIGVWAAGAALAIVLGLAGSRLLQRAKAVVAQIRV